MLSMLGLTAFELLTSGGAGLATGLVINALRAWNNPVGRLAARVADMFDDDDGEEPSIQKPPRNKTRKSNAKK